MIPEITISDISPERLASDLAVFFVKEAKNPKCSPYVVEMARRVYAAGDFTGKTGQNLLYYPDTKPKKALKSPRVLLVGIGKKDWRGETLRKAGGTVAAAAQKTKANHLAVFLGDYNEINCPAGVEALTEGILLGAYQFRKYKSSSEEENDAVHAIRRVTFHSPDAPSLQEGMRRGKVAAFAAWQARDMANEPANHWTPEHFARYGAELAGRHGLTFKILEKKDMEDLGMGGILAVNQGAAIPPKMVIVEYLPSEKKPVLLLVGKGLTFDSGGISLKQSAGMDEMKYDMCGGAAVLAAMEAVGEERPDHIGVVAMVPATENLPGPTAVKPGDVVTLYNGKKVEVVNTDAEGRIILGDALAYGIEQYAPAAAIDIATLTGSVVIGLGHHRTGLMSNDDTLADAILKVGEKCGEPLWRLPLGPEYKKQLKSEVADIKNAGKRDGGTITAATFLQEFVGKTPWAHLDIAGTAWNYTEKSYIPKGPSAVGVRTLIELIRHWKKGPKKRR